MLELPFRILEFSVARKWKYSCSSASSFAIKCWNGNGKINHDEKVGMEVMSFIFLFFFAVENAVFVSKEMYHLMIKGF